MDTTFEKVRRMMVEHLGYSPNEIKPESTFEELNMDDFDILELAMLAEEEFDITTSDDFESPDKTVQELIDYIDKLVAEKANSNGKE